MSGLGLCRGVETEPIFSLPRLTRCGRSPKLQPSIERVVGRDAQDFVAARTEGASLHCR
ncbi:MAG: hypothetical protein RL334_351 [Chloroflexota bacterium]